MLPCPPASHTTLNMFKKSGWSTSEPYRSISLSLTGSNGTRPCGSGLHQPARVDMISRIPVFIAASFLLFSATLIVKAALGSSSSIFQDRVSHSRPLVHCRAHTWSCSWTFCREQQPLSSKSKAALHSHLPRSSPPPRVAGHSQPHLHPKMFRRQEFK